MIKNIFAIIGFIVSTLAVASSFGVGNFALIYQDEKIQCIDEFKAEQATSSKEQ